MNIFDPLSIIIKLAILSKKSDNTKISIKNYILLIQSSSKLQGLIRYMNDDNKYDMKNIVYPIKLACDIYLKNNNLIFLFKLAQNGILLLINTYKNHLIIIYTLKYAHTIIDVYINNLNNKTIFNNYNSNILLLYNNIITLSKSLSINTLTKSLSTNTLTKSLSTSTLTKSLSPSTLSKSLSTNTLSKSFSSDSIFNSDNNYMMRELDKDFIMSRQNSMNNDNDNIHLLDNNIKKTIHRYGATGYFILDDIEIINNDKIYNEIIETLNYINKINDIIIKNNITIYDELILLYNDNLLNKFKLFWTDNKIKYILNLIDKYIYHNILTIETYMNEIDNDIVNIILNYYHNIH